MNVISSLALEQTTSIGLPVFFVLISKSLPFTVPTLLKVSTPTTPLKSLPPILILPFTVSEASAPEPSPGFVLSLIYNVFSLQAAKTTDNIMAKHNLANRIN